jgi:hypothetical protein
MFGHLKPADFVNLIEAAELPARQRAHIESCWQCRATWQSMRSLHEEIISVGTDIPEPNWAEFRSSVRDKLLSRSIQRQSAVRRWTGWTMRPAVAWALSLVMAVGITTVTLLWKADQQVPPPAPPLVESIVPEATVEAMEADPERSLFDDLVSLGEEQQEQLRHMLESAQHGVTYRQ